MGLGSLGWCRSRISPLWSGHAGADPTAASVFRIIIVCTTVVILLLFPLQLFSISVNPAASPWKLSPSSKEQKLKNVKGQLVLSCFNSRWICADRSTNYTLKQWWLASRKKLLHLFPHLFSSARFSAAPSVTSNQITHEARDEVQGCNGNP